MPALFLILGIALGWITGRKLDSKKQVLAPYQRERALFGQLRTTANIVAAEPTQMFQADATAYARPNPVTRPGLEIPLSLANNPRPILPSFNIRG